MNEFLDNVCIEILEDLYENDQDFKDKLIVFVKSKVYDAFDRINLEKVIDEEMNGLVQHLMTNDDYIYENARKLLWLLIKDKLEVRVKNEEVDTNHA